MSQVLFVGGGLDSVTGAGLAENNGGFHDATYAPSCLLAAPGVSWTATCLDASVTPTTVVGGQTFYGHFGFNFTNPYATGNPVVVLNDSAGFPWVSIRSNGGSPTFGLYYNSNTGASPTWTQIGANFSMAQNTSPYQRLDISVAIGGGGSHTATVWNKEVQVATGNFTQASFTNIQTMVGTGPVGGSGEFWEIIMTEGQSTVGSRVGYSLANGAGTNAGWTGAFSAVNPAVCTDATNNTSGTAAQKSTYAFGDITVPATNTIRSVWQWIRGKNDGSAPSNIKVVCRSAGTDYPGAANVPGITTTFKALPGRFDVDPATSVAWTQTGFNAAEFGFLSAT
jgi:hypothetical protein